MNEILAERLLANIMGWSPEMVAYERPFLQFLAEFKYDEYQPFSPGMRFLESLALWLKQFQSIEERKIAYEFIRNRLIFISNKEMMHLITIAYPDYIRPLLIKRVAKIKKIPEWYIKEIIKSSEFDIVLRQCLFLGLSDGAHVDVFRRSNPNISHEQVLRTHEISNERASNMIENLEKDLEKIMGKKLLSKEVKFKIVFLLDDFSCSGLSYLKKERTQYKGKIYNFYNAIYKENKEISKMFDLSDLEVCLILYVASNGSRKYLKQIGVELFNKINVKFNVVIVHLIPDDLKVNEIKEKSFLNIMKKYFDSKVIDSHFKKGKHDKPYLGFNEGGFPLILSHNTPNNSICLLWFYEGMKYRGLFPRITRHRDEL